MNARVITLLAAGAVAIGIVGVLIAGSGDEENEAPETPVTSAPTSVTARPSPAQANSQKPTIRYKSSGFEPKKLTVKAGQEILISNDIRVEFSSEPHPSHTENSELNLEITNPSKGAAFTPNKKGTFGFHDHLKPSNSGEITVE